MPTPMRKIIRLDAPSMRLEMCGVYELLDEGFDEVLEEDMESDSKSLRHPHLDELDGDE